MVAEIKSTWGKVYFENVHDHRKHGNICIHDDCNNNKKKNDNNNDDNNDNSNIACLKNQYYNGLDMMIVKQSVERSAFLHWLAHSEHQKQFLWQCADHVSLKGVPCGNRDQC